MKRLIKAFGYSLDGLRAAWRDEAAFREEVLCAIVLLPAAFFIAGNGVELALLVVSVLLVMVVELLNTAIEAAIDRHGPELHPLAKKAKDAGSAAVLVMLVAAFFVWCAIILA